MPLSIIYSPAEAGEYVVLAAAAAVAVTAVFELVTDLVCRLDCRLDHVNRDRERHIVN